VLRYWGWGEWEFDETVYQLFIIDFKKAYDLVRKEILHNILTEFEVQLVKTD
jgi:hypothetical protein